MHNEFSMNLNKQSGCGSIPHVTQIHSEIGKKMSTILCLCVCVCVCVCVWGGGYLKELTLSEGQVHSNWFQNVEFSGLSHLTKLKEIGV